MIVSTRINEKFVDINILGLSIPLETILAIVTVGALIYAARTFVASRKNNELKTVPTLIMKRKTGGSNFTMELKNLTDNLAYNIHIDPLFMINQIDCSIYKINFFLKDPNYIDAKGSRELTEYKLKDGAVELDTDFAKIVSEFAGRRPIVIRFKDSQGLNYYTVLNFVDGNEKIIESPRRLTLFRRLKLYFMQRKRYYKYKRYQGKKFSRTHPDLEDKSKTNRR
jgi:hypothetical protein